MPNIDDGCQKILAYLEENGIHLSSLAVKYDMRNILHGKKKDLKVHKLIQLRVMELDGTLLNLTDLSELLDMSSDTFRAHQHKFEVLGFLKELLNKGQIRRNLV